MKDGPEGRELARCSSCGADVPPLTYCVRCGARLGGVAHGYVASPEERLSIPRVVSTLFPRLPRAAMPAFRFAFAVGVALVTGLTVGGFYPVAVCLSAVAVPVLTAIYLYDVDVYEDEPLIVYGLTVAWGAAMGLVVAVVGRGLVPSGADLVTQTTLHAIVTQGVVLPLLGLALGLAGPLVLLPYHRFDDVLDGTTFGAVSAAWLFATQLLLQSASLFDEGVRPQGAVGTWVLRLLQLAVTGPLLWASIGGAVAGTFWLRYRAVLPRVRATSVWSPWTALVLAAATVVASAVAQITLTLWAAAIVSALAAAGGLLWLRRLIHFGLVNEASAIEIGPEITCANCGGLTPRHAFCGRCGVALRALPKARAATVAPGFRSGSASVRLRDRLALSAFGLTLLAVGAGASGVLAAFAPETAARSCFPGEPCGGPPSTSPRLTREIPWRSLSGVALTFDAERWLIEGTEANRLILRSDDGGALVEIRVGRRLAGGSCGDDLPRWVRVSKRLGLPIPHGPNVGYIDGSGAWCEGLLDTPQGPRDHVTVASLAAERRGIDVVTTAVFFFSGSQLLDRTQRPLRDAVDSILNTVVWPSAKVGNAGPSTPREGLRPLDVARAYDIAPLWRRGIRGRGETVAVISLDTFRDEDIAAYDRSVGIAHPSPVEHVPVLGPVELGIGSPLEVALDLEIIRAVAPDAGILSYEAPLSWDGFIAALKKVNDDGRASLVSLSWGKCIARVEPSVRAGMERELARAAARGTTIFVASGDSGAYSCLHSESELDPAMHEESIDWPAASPNVVAVGGTRLSVREDGTYFSEDGWEDTLGNRGAGGGISPASKQPSWQAGRGVENRFSNGNRQIPDIAGPADCDTGFFVVYPARRGDRWMQRRGRFGCGTSAAAPFWAATAALVRQYARRNGVRRLGFLAPVLYDVAATTQGRRPFHDVQTGGNLEQDAGPGWDFATGLGSPDVWQLARAVVEYARGRPRTT